MSIRKILGLSKEESSPKDKHTAARSFFRFANRMEDSVSALLETNEVSSGKSGKFDAKSLLSWVEIAKKANVPHVEAAPITTISTDVIDRLTSMKLTAEDAPVLNRILDDMDKLPAGWMVRHDHCGSGILKMAAAIGTPPRDANEQWRGDVISKIMGSASKRYVPIGCMDVGNRIAPDVTDERIFKAIARSLKDEQTFVARPWISAKMRHGMDPHREGSDFAGMGTWPAEWRVFVMNGEVTGVSSYYIQTDAPGDDDDMAAIDACKAHVERMIEVMRDGRLMPFDPMVEIIQNKSKSVRKKMPKDSINFSADFIQLEDGTVLFLEAGPPYTPAPYRYGAHPCCFLGREWPEGIALKLDDGIDPMGLGEKKATQDEQSRAPGL